MRKNVNTIYPPLNLVLLPDPVLRQTCMPVDQFDGRLADIIEEMRTLMNQHHGIGLAAPQVGLKERFFVAEISGQFVALVNPLIVNSGGSDEMKEGCLSLPDTQIRIPRRTTIDLAGYDILGHRRLQHFDGLWARVVQHELDHLNGVLICDYSRTNSSLDHEVSA
jgi:peptide deformylase